MNGAVAFAPKATVPKEVNPSKNVTFPVGFPFVAVTVAVKVTGDPKVDGLDDEVSVVVVLPDLTVSVVLLSVAPLKLPAAK